MKPTDRKLWASNLLLWSDLTFGLSFKVKQWFTDFAHLVDTVLHQFTDA